MAIRNEICAPAHQTTVRAGFRLGGRSAFVAPARRPGLLVAAALSLAIGTCACTKKVTVPNVVEQEIAQAEQTLASAQLKPGNVTSAQGTVAPGAHVLSQSPPAGQQVPADSAVDLVAEALATVPDLTKSSVTDAVNTLQGLGLKAAFMKQSSLNIFGGAKVVEQTPAAATVVPLGTVVTLTVKTVPDIDAAFGLVSKEPAYSQLNPEYRKVVDALFGK